MGVQTVQEEVLLSTSSALSHSQKHGLPWF